ncbi:lipopolysaccharide N-acetylmannosaminouronosyltransferase [Mannheimia granulomatis]|uniref:lipopolysaccharide N-acetylmannosaminouronosyltransferase n=1 Tax=Mannheimia granulomatis TaxID=85402 RepID=UPI000478FEF7|nr:lipopolysaccharide N-acetylmannosaminouronosyltransferase [Mannheimia granulomatis]QLB18257.1 lipopolysaccharide N-acetylmannosaminouronosyltransferase [Mannheimia granulomatis]
MIEKVSIRGIELQAVKNQEIFANFLMNEKEIKKGRLVAINAEKVILAEQNPKLYKFLQESELNYADGISIVYSIKKKYPKHNLERIAGADLWEALMKKAGELNVPVFLVGGTEKTIKAIETKLIKWQVNIVGTQHGYFPEEQEDELIDNIKQSGAKLITVAMGTPKQEFFIQKVHQQYPNALYMGCGGSYDVFIGKVKRAPQIWQKLGLEWLYRLIKQPTRWRRQINLIKYACYYATNKL